MKTARLLRVFLASLFLLICVASSLAAPQFGGRQLTEEQAQAREQRLKTDPNDFDARSQLLTYYTFSATKTSIEEAANKVGPHLQWFIEHHPESELLIATLGLIDPFTNPELYEQCKTKWLQEVQSHPDDPRVLENAARFLSSSDLPRAEELLSRVLQLEPGNTSAAEQLAAYYEASALHADPDSHASFQRKAAEVQDKALENASAEERFYGLGRAARSALELGDTTKAKRYATELLAVAPGYRDNWNYGNAVHHGNLILGRISLREGNIEDAKARLKAAGDTPGSPQLDSFGPNMSLAKELLEKGEREAVLTYFDQCAKFWKMSRGQLTAWSEAVKQGLTPDFGANLAY